MKSRLLVLTTSDSAAGYLRQAKPDADIVSVSHRVVYCQAPIPIDPAVPIHEVPTGAGDHPSRTRIAGLAAKIGGNQVMASWSDLPNLCSSAHAVEIWPDTEVNAQLVLCQLLAWLGGDARIASKLNLVQLDTPAGQLCPDAMAGTKSTVSDRDIGVAVRVWRAFAQPTPEAFASARELDFGPLRHLSGAMEKMLDELPHSKTGLNASQHYFVNLVGQQELSPIQALGRYARLQRPVFNYWEAGRLLFELLRAPFPAIAGVEDSQFTNELHNDGENFMKLKSSVMTLTDLGRSLMTGASDFLDKNSLDRWWGGTRLTSGNSWRWDDLEKKVKLAQ